MCVQKQPTRSNDPCQAYAEQHRKEHLKGLEFHPQNKNKAK